MAPDKSPAAGEAAASDMATRVMSIWASGKIVATLPDPPS
jgi:hypothetical protein